MYCFVAAFMGETADQHIVLQNEGTIAFLLIPIIVDTVS